MFKLRGVDFNLSASTSFFITIIGTAAGGSLINIKN